MNAAISAVNLTKFYGSQAAIEQVSFAIFPGDIVGYLGINGAGKTTTIRILAGLQSPTRGEALIDGVDMTRHPRAAKAQIGYVPETRHLFEFLSGYEYLQFVGRIYGLEDSIIDAKIGEWSRFADLAPETLRRQQLGTYSKGMKQKISIGAALLHEPRILILDEPLDGLDSHFIVHFKKFIREQAAAGAAVLFSSHLIDVVENLCTRVLLLHQGRIRLDSPVGDLQSRFGDMSLEAIFTKLTDKPT